MPISIDISEDKVFIELSNRVSELESLLFKKDYPVAIKSGKVRSMLGGISTTELRTLINNRTLKPFKLYEDGHLYYKTDDILALIPRR